MLIILNGKRIMWKKITNNEGKVEWKNQYGAIVSVHERVDLGHGK